MLFLPKKSSKRRLWEAENARKNRWEILKALADGQITRRDLLKWGLFTAGGVIVAKSGLSPFVRSAYAGSSSTIPTGLPPSPTFGVQPFTAPMARMDVLPRNAVSTLNPAPTAQANTTQQLLNTALEGVVAGDTGPIEGRPPGAIWTHQGFAKFPPQVAIEVTTEGAKSNTTYNPGVASSLNSGINPANSFPPSFNPNFPNQGPLALWTFNGTIPPKLAQIRYGEPVLFRHHNKLPFDITQNGGFGRHTTSTHKHNAHHGAENDGFTGAFFFPAQFYDYQHRGDGPARRHAERRRRHHQRRRRLARDHEQPLVPRPHVQLHLAERVQGHGGDGQYLQLPGSRRRGHQRRREPQVAERPGERLGQIVGQPRLRREPDARGQGLGRERAARHGHLRLRRLPGRPSDREPLLEALLRSRAAQVPLPHPERRRVALLHDLALRRLADDPDRQRRQSPADAGDAHATGRAGHRRALRHRHRLLALQRRPEGVDGESGPASGWAESRQGPVA